MGALGEAIRFLQLVRPEGPWCLCALYPDDDSPRVKGDEGKRAVGFVARSEQEARAWLEQREGKANLHYIVNPLQWDKVTGRPSAALLTCATHKHVDIDCDKGHDPNEDLAAAIERSKKVVLNILQRFDFPGPPLAIVDSGGGLQAIWQLKAPVDADTARSVNRGLVEVLLGDPQCISPVHPLRLPGTTNLPNAKKRERGRVPVLARLIWTDPERRTWPADAFPSLDAESLADAAPSIAPVFVESLDDLNLSERLRQIVLKGHTDIGRKPKDTSRSGWAFHLAEELCKLGVPEGVIMGLQLDGRFAISESALKRGGGALREAERTTRRAAAKVRRQNEAHEKQKAEAIDALAAELPEVEEPRKAKRQTVDGLSFRFGSDIELEKIDWLWPNRFARGKVNSLSGDPGLSKTTFLLTIAATITRGAEWPDGSGKAEQGYVIIVSAEDDAADTLMPRFVAAGGDPDFLVIVEPSVKPEKDTRLRQFSVAEDMPRLAKLIKRLGRDRVKLIGLDPIGALIGSSASLNSYSDQDVRFALAPLKMVAEAFNVAALFIGHFKKGSTGKAAERVLGSTAFVALARCNWVVVEELKGTVPNGRLLFAKAKQNIGEPVGAVAYRIESVTLDGDIRTSRIVWEGELAGSADDLLRPAQGEGGKLDAAIAFLEAMLTEGRVAAGEVLRMAEDCGHAERTIRRAKEELDVRVYQEDRIWWWALPYGGTEG